MVSLQESSESQAFEAQVVECLVDRLQTVPSAITYSNLAEMLASRFGLDDARAWHYFDAALGRIQDTCETLGLPSLPVMVVRKDTMNPGVGFAPYYRKSHPECADMSDEQIAKQQLRAVVTCKDWQRLLDYYGIEMTFEGPKDYFAEMEARECYEEGRRIETVLRSEIERNPAARKYCLEKKGETCVVCGFNSVERYGIKGIIHVHHKKPLFELTAGELRMTDALEDLEPVCPNCHALIHSKGARDWYTIEEARKLIEEATGE